MDVVLLHVDEEVVLLHVDEDVVLDVGLDVYAEWVSLGLLLARLLVPGGLLLGNW
jgi:hypothetical protein